MKNFLPRLEEEGFSLIELVIVIAVLAILSVVGIPYFLKVINMARFASAKNHMRESFTSCINAPNIAPTNPYIPGVAFQASNCSSLMSATIDNSCTISMDMSTGAKTGWTDSYDQCVSATNTASNNGSSETNNGTGDGNTGSANGGDIAVVGTNDKGDKIFEGPSCSMGNESKVEGNFGMETVSGGLHCNCDPKKGESYAYTINKDPMTGETGGSVNLSCYGQDGERVEGGSSWGIPNTDNPGGRSGDNYDWLRYKKWVNDGGKPGEFHSNTNN